MKFDSPITAAAKRMTMLVATGYLAPEIKRDIETLMQGAMAFEVTQSKSARGGENDAT